MFVFIFHSCYHRLAFFDSLIHILIALLFYIFFYILKFISTNLQEKVTLRKLIKIITNVKDIEKESAGNDDKKIML